MVKLVLNQEGNKITGYYTWDDGILYGKMDKNILSGNWNEKPTRKPLDDAGRIMFAFNIDEFTGRYGFGNQPLYYKWDGNKISNLLLGNCIRYQVCHDAPNIPSIIVNGEKISMDNKVLIFILKNAYPILILN